MKYLMMVAAMLAYLVPAQARAEATASEQIASIREMQATTLQRLYAEKPAARDEIKRAVGYAVFSSGELAVIWVSAGYGHGIAHSNTDKSDTFMKMAKVGAGLGLGAKDFNTVFVFNDAKSYNDFINTGLDLSGTADAAAKAGDDGAAASAAANVLPGVRIYQLTDSGLLAQAMIQGTKYWRDDELNSSKVSGR